MGLDMMAGWAEPQPKREDNVVPIKEEYKDLKDEFYWRKHSRLHNLMQTMWFCKKHEGTIIPSGEELAKMVCKGDTLNIPEDKDERSDLYTGLTGAIGSVVTDFNCTELQLDKTDLEIIRDLVKTNQLPFCHDGFFWGHQFQEEAMREYKDQDLEFCDKALKWLEEGKEVYYRPSW